VGLTDAVAVSSLLPYSPWSVPGGYYIRPDATTVYLGGAQQFWNGRSGPDTSGSVVAVAADTRMTTNQRRPQSSNQAVGQGRN
jgi:hypothetical protein